MQDWEQFFKLIYHPNPGFWEIHWVADCTPVKSHGFLHKMDAERWIRNNGQRLIDVEFEETFLGKSVEDVQHV